ncbi:MAG: TIM barrel protein, partial [Candidatus Poribacteria bacterium]
MGKIKQSFCYPLFHGDQTLDELVGGAAEIGYAAIELWGRDGAPFDELCELAEKHGIVVASMCGHDSLPNGLNTRDNHGRIQEELHESIDIAAERGIPGLICSSGNRNGLGDDEGIDICAEGLDRVKGYVDLGVEEGADLVVYDSTYTDEEFPKFVNWGHSTWQEGVRLCDAAGAKT